MVRNQAQTLESQQLPDLYFLEIFLESDTVITRYPVHQWRDQDEKCLPMDAVRGARRELELYLIDAGSFNRRLVVYLCASGLQVSTGYLLAVPDRSYSSPEQGDALELDVLGCRQRHAGSCAVRRSGN